MWDPQNIPTWLKNMFRVSENGDFSKSPGVSKLKWLNMIINGLVWDD
jgi:hypothetical protein